MTHLRHLSGLIALLWSSAAVAWPTESLPSMNFSQPLVSVTLIQSDDGVDRAVVLSKDTGWITRLYPAQVERQLPIGGVDSTLHDLNGDGKEQLIICSERGLVSFDLTNPKSTAQPLSTTPCRRVASFYGKEGPALAALGEHSIEVHTLNAEGNPLIKHWPVESYEGAPLLVSHRSFLALGWVGEHKVMEFSPSGQSTFFTDGPIQDLTFGPQGWVWSLQNRAVISSPGHRISPLSHTPLHLSSGHLDDDGEREVLVSYTDGFSVLSGGRLTEQRTPLSFTPSDLLSADADGDGCDDVILVQNDPAMIQVFRSTACVGVPLHRTGAPKAVQSYVPLRPGQSLPYTRVPLSYKDNDLSYKDDDVETDEDKRYDVFSQPSPPPVSGFWLRPFLGSQALSPAERQRRQRYSIVGSGLAVGGTLAEPLSEIPFFPAISLEQEFGSRRARVFLGVDTAGLFFWSSDSGSGVHLANLSAGLAFGSPRLRTGPFVTAGLVNVGAGLRTVFTPTPSNDWETRGVELRLTWFAPRTGEIMLLYVWSQAHQDFSQDADKLPDFYPDSFGACARFQGLLGATLGGSMTRNSWEYLGEDSRVELKMSPALALGCELGPRRTGVYLGVESAPLYGFITPTGRRRFHMGSVTIGPMIGPTRARFGPIVTAGVWAFGGGARLSFDVAPLAKVGHHRLELRAQVFPAPFVAAEAWLLYGFSYDPRKASSD